MPMTSSATPPAPRSRNLSNTTTRPAWLDTAQYPFAAHTFRHRDGVLHYVDEGHGSPVLFVHGTPSWSYEWRAAIQHLQSRYRCLAIDHLGFGLSEKPTTAPYLPRDHTDRLHAFIQMLDLRDVTLVVHDFGGPIATPLVARDPSRFRQVIAVNTWVWSTSDDVRGQKLSKLVRSPLGRLLYLWFNASPRWLVPASFADKNRLTKNVHRHLLAPFPTRQERYAPWTLGCNLTNPEAYAPELPQVITALGAVPVSLIWGMKDGILGPEPFTHWQHAFPKSRVIELSESGHFPQEESPDAFLSALDSVLATS